MNIKSVSTHAVQEIPHRSRYEIGVSKTLLPPKEQQTPKDVVLEGPGHFETTLHYQVLDAWIDDMMISFTYFVAERAYTSTQQTFFEWSADQANTNTNSWLI